MTTPGKITTILAVLSAAALALAGCSSDDDAPDEAQDNQLEALMVPDARPDQKAAGGATAMAMELGFDQVQPATDAEITSVRDAAAERTDAAEDLSVEPASCAAPIAELDWSPIQASSDAVTRVDFGRTTFRGAGSVEVAGITEATGGTEQAAEQVAAHQRAVEEITTNCNDVTMMLADDAEPDWAALEYAFTAEAIETDSGSGLLWQRQPVDESQGQSTTALTLMTKHEGHAIMVAFIGSEEIADEEFTGISEAILASAVAQLD